MILTIEYNLKGFVEIYMDEEGRDSFIRYLLRLRADRPGSDHDHLATPSWAGVELTEDPQNVNNSLIKQVNLYLVQNESILQGK